MFRGLFCFAIYFILVFDCLLSSGATNVFLFVCFYIFVLYICAFYRLDVHCMYIVLSSGVINVI